MRRTPIRSAGTAASCACKPTIRRTTIRLPRRRDRTRSEEHTSELQSLMRISYAVFCLKKKLVSSYLTTKIQNNCNTEEYRKKINRTDIIRRYSTHQPVV